MILKWIRAAALFTSCVLSTVSHAQAPTLLAAVTDMQLLHRVFAPLAQTACGSDWYVIDGRRWMCARPNQDGRWLVTQFGPPMFEGGFQLPVRGPVAGERRLIHGALQGQLHWWDPVTNQSEPLGNLPGGLVLDVTQTDPLLVDYNGDGHMELLFRPQFSSSQMAIAALPGGPFPALQQLGVISDPWHITPDLVGQFDADLRSELMRIEADQLRFLDVGTAEVEAYAVSGSFALPAMAVNWDGDAADEMLLARSGSPVVALVDVGGSVHDVTLAGSGPVRGYAPVNWNGDARNEVAIVWQDKIAVVDPRLGVVIASFDWYTPDFHYRRPTVIDWEQDDDQDGLWLDDGMVLLQNPQGPMRLQLSAGAKKPLGLREIAGDPVLVSLEFETGWGRQAARVTQREPFGLALRASAPIDGCPTSGISALGSHPSDPLGVVYCVAGVTLRAFAASTGQLLWTRDMPLEPAGTFSPFVVSADATCVGIACNRAVLLFNTETGPRIEMIDASTGGALHSVQQLPSARFPSVMATDVTGDGVPDLLFDERGGVEPGSPAGFLIAVDGHSHQQLWRTETPRDIADLGRIPSGRRRIMAFDEFCNTYLVDGASGALHARGKLPSVNFCDGSFASIRYFTRGLAPAYFVMSGLILREDLGREIAYWAGVVVGIVDSGDGRAYQGGETDLRRFQFPVDDFFPDGFEDW